MRGRVHAGELTRVGLAFAAFFLLLSSYYMLRPVRDEMGVQTGVDRLQWLFTGTLVVTLLTVPVFGWVVKRVPRASLLPVVYGFVIVNLLLFYAGFAAGITPVIAAAFFIWLSVFNVLVVSLFWSNVSDAFTTEQSHRLYGYIAAGGTAGALAGPALTALLARYFSSAHLLALSALLLAGAAGCMVLLRRAHPAGEDATRRPIGGSVLAGIPLTLKLPSLRGVALLVICYTAVHTVLYVEMADLAQRTYPDSGERTAFFATLDLAVNGLALAIQLFVTRPVVQRYGLAVALAMVPLVVLAGLAAAGFWRTAILLVGTQTVNRAGEFSLVRPGREMIYTTVDPESRYKAKNFIDTTVYRANDAAISWLVSVVRGAGLDAVALTAIPVAVGWVLTAFRVGRRHDRKKRDMAEAGTSRRDALRLIGAGALGLMGAPFAAGRAAPAAAPMTRIIPSSGEAVPVIGVGTWQTFDVGRAPAERAPLEEVLGTFVALGGKVIDSSPMYGKSEEVVGDIAAKLGLRPKLFVATKVWTSGKASGIEQMNESMRKLRADPIDLMQVHNLLDAGTHLDTLFGWKREGRVRYVGATHYTAGSHDDVAKVVASQPVDFIQINYSSGERDAERRLLPLARERGVAVIANRPFAGGDLFRRLRSKPLPAYAAEIDCETWAQLMLKFIVSYPAITCAIPGTSKVEHLRDNMKAGEGRLPDEKLRSRIATEAV